VDREAGLRALPHRDGDLVVTGREIADWSSSSPETVSGIPMTLWVSRIIAARPPPRSNTTVSWPSRVAYSAAVRPAGPPPTTATSYVESAFASSAPVVIRQITLCNPITYSYS